ncbi:MAG: hypothetical protein Q7U91_11695 [Sideroxyarcus sp.]|nr:hypothetical protein [Sideroxyarcus sp.]
MKRRHINTTNMLKIVRDGAIAMPDIGDGRLIPVLIIDCDTRRDLFDMVMAHEDTPPGDVTVTWAKDFFSFNTKRVYLIIDFKKPVETEAIIEFDLEKYGGIADLIITARAFYFQPKESGARVIEGLTKPKILIEVPYGAKLDNWDSILHNMLVRKFRKQGASKKEAKTATQQHLKKWRSMALRESPTQKEDDDEGN